MAAKLSVLIASRKNSKYLAKFLMGLIRNTHSLSQIEILVIMNEHDTWNKELVHFFEHGFGPDNQHHVRFFYEDLRLGRAGLHEYFNILTKNATGDWLVYFCDDHFIDTWAWDLAIYHTISGNLIHGDSAGKNFPLNPAAPYIIVPQFDNCGAMNHIVSRGFINALDGRIGNHGWIDSYINDLAAATWRKHDLAHIIRMDKPIFHDFTHDDPSPMSDAHMQSVLTPEADHLPKFQSEEYNKTIEHDAEKLRRYADEVQG